MNNKIVPGADDLPAPETEVDARLLEVIRAAEAVQRPHELGITLRPGPGGLYLPEGTPTGPSPLDLVQVYATADDILGFEPGAAWLMTAFDHMHLSDVLQFATTWTARTESINADWGEVDREFAERYLSGDLLSRAHAILRAPRRRLVVPQALLVMTKLALFRCGSAERTQEQVNLLPAALFAVASGLNASEGSPSSERIVGEMVANQHFNNRTDYFTNIALHEARWRNPRYAEGSPELAEDFARATGLTLDDFTAVVLAIWTQIEANGVPFFKAGVLGETLPPGAVEGVLNLISATPDQMRQEIIATENTPETRWNSVPWTFSAFERYPLLAHDDGWYVVSPRYLFNRLFSWAPVFDVKDTMLRQGRAKDAARFETRVRASTERYVQDVIATTYEQLPRRVYTESGLRAELGREHKVADVAIDYGHSWVVADISTRRLMREAAHGGASVTLDSEIDALCKKFVQVNSTIRRIRETRFQVRGSADGLVRFYPVLILTEGYPVNPIILSRLHEVLRMKRILTGRDTADPEIMDLSDLEAVESLAANGGPTLIEVIRSKQEGPLRLADLTSHIRNVMHLNPTRPARVKDAADRVFTRVAKVLAPAPEIELADS